jgi:putative sigma-54 modulation protein
MEVQITSRHSKASQSLQDTIAAELNKLERFAEKITSCHVVLDTEHLDHKVEITMHVFDRQVVAVEKAENIGKAFDGALDKIERQLIKINQKIKDHKHFPSDKSEGMSG